MTRLVRSPIWHCEVGRLRCQMGHPYRQKRSHQRVRVLGPCLLLYECPECEPPTFAVCIQITDPAPLVTLYAVSAEQLELAAKLWEEKVRLTTILAKLGYRQEAA